MTARLGHAPCFLSLLLASAIFALVKTPGRRNWALSPSIFPRAGPCNRMLRRFESIHQDSRPQAISPWIFRLPKQQPWTCASAIRRFGEIFLGRLSPEACLRAARPDHSSGLGERCNVPLAKLKSWPCTAPSQGLLISPCSWTQRGLTCFPRSSGAGSDAQPCHISKHGLNSSLKRGRQFVRRAVEPNRSGHAR